MVPNEEAEEVILDLLMNRATSLKRLPPENPEGYRSMNQLYEALESKLSLRETMIGKPAFLHLLEELEKQGHIILVRSEAVNRIGVCITRKYLLEHPTLKRKSTQSFGKRAKIVLEDDDGKRLLHTASFKSASFESERLYRIGYRDALGSFRSFGANTEDLIGTRAYFRRMPE